MTQGAATLRRWPSSGGEGQLSAKPNRKLKSAQLEAQGAECMDNPQAQHLQTYFLFPFSIDREAVAADHPDLFAKSPHWFAAVDDWVRRGVRSARIQSRCSPGARRRSTPSVIGGWRWPENRRQVGRLRRPHEERRATFTVPYETDNFRVADRSARDLGSAFPTTPFELSGLRPRTPRV